MKGSWKAAFTRQLQPENLVWTLAGVIVGQGIIQFILWVARSA